MRTGAAEAASLSADEANPEARRIQTGSQQVEVTNVGTAVSAARDIVRRAGGRVESSSVRVSDTEERGTAEMQIRVAATDLEETADALAGLGHETFRRIEDQDVAVQWIDLEAQLQNQIALRDRLKRLLNDAKTVKDALEIEKELARVQALIDSMTAQFRSLQNRVQMASLSLGFSERSIPGPAGLAMKGMGWSLRKLFVLK
ncbi:MAG: DUF4349 domain-containing protein [Verrucomicrobia bacterium]|nr:DUF4349 domain-containing protein [Verrucomicrobiota bacterium]